MRWGALRCVCNHVDHPPVKSQIPFWCMKTITVVTFALDHSAYFSTDAMLHGQLGPEEIPWNSLSSAALPHNCGSRFCLYDPDFRKSPHVVRQSWPRCWDELDLKCMGSKRKSLYKSKSYRSRGLFTAESQKRRAGWLGEGLWIIPGL